MSNRIINLSSCNNCSSKDYKKQEYKIKQRTYKQAKLETDRYSVFTDNLDKCFLCGSTYQISKHELFCGRNRKNSMKYSFILPLCLKCHSSIQEDKDFNQHWHDKCREYWLKNYGTLEDFIKVFGKSYIKKEAN